MEITNIDPLFIDDIGIAVRKFNIKRHKDARLLNDDDFFEFVHQIEFAYQDYLLNPIISLCEKIRLGEHIEVIYCNNGMKIIDIDPNFIKGLNYIFRKSDYSTQEDYIRDVEEDDQYLFLEDFADLMNDFFLEPIINLTRRFRLAKQINHIKADPKRSFKKYYQD